MLVEVREIVCEKNVDDEQIKQNLRTNACIGLPVLKLRRAAVVGGGPSFADHIQDIADLQRDGCDVFALNGVARVLIENGVIPDYHVFYDARPQNTVFITETHAKNYLVSSHIHPDVLTALEGRNVRLFHSLAAQYMIEEVRALDPNAHILGGGITVGLQMLNILVCMGYRGARFYGYDSSNRGAAHHGYAQPMNDGIRPLKCCFRGQDYEANTIMLAQAREFMAIAPQYEALGLEMEVIGEGLLPDMWAVRKSCPKPTNIEEAEAQKYTVIWDNPDYRKYSPGENLVEAFIQETEIAAPARIIDFGCGSGRASIAFIKRGFSVLGVDHAHNCLDPGVTIPLCISNLWKLPDLPPADWGFCADVMEHIPPDKVDDVLNRISANVINGCLFSISFVQDVFGKRIGKPLHLTVKPLEWWLSKLNEKFDEVKVCGSTVNSGVFICRRMSHGCG